MLSPVTPLPGTPDQSVLTPGVIPPNQGSRHIRPVEALSSPRGPLLMSELLTKNYNVHSSNNWPKKKSGFGTEKGDGFTVVCKKKKSMIFGKKILI